MLTVQRLKACATVLGVAAAVTCTHALGESGRGGRDGSPARPPRSAVSVPAGKFAGQSVLTYATTKGETLFALQVKPRLAAEDRPRDLLVMIDTSASQAGPAFAAARAVAAELAAALRPEDRLAVWTVNTPAATRDLTRGFRAPKAEAVASALKALTASEYASGATDLKGGLAKALAAFEQRSDRAQAVVFLGDGESAYDPIGEADRVRLADRFAERGVGFFPVPLGTALNPQNLHGLATGTGGVVVRYESGDKPAAAAGRLLAAVDGPVLHPKPLQAPAGVAEFYPAKLPPLRADAPTLVVGKFAAPARKLEFAVEGTVNGRPATVRFSEAVPEPEADHYFLVGVVAQWKSAERADAPALVRADRALALAYEQTRLTRDEYLTHAQWALSEARVDAAEKLFRAAREVDPGDREAAVGLELVEKVKAGKAVLPKNAVAFARQDEPKKEPKEAVAPPPTPLPPAADVPGTPVDANELLRQELRRRAVREQQLSQLVEDSVRTARGLLNTDPDGANDLLKRQLNSVRESADVSEATRQALARRLETVLRTVAVEGARIRQRIEDERERRIRAAERAQAAERALSQEETIRERIRAFTNLMNQARFEEAYREALVMQQESLSRGQPVPVEATAAYTMSLTASNVREYQEVNRLKQERYLLTMMQVERSHVPYPDEPPIHFPPATVWRSLAAARTERYSNSGLGEQVPPRTIQLRNKLSQSVNVERDIDNATLRTALDYFADLAEVTFLVDTESFKAAGAAGSIEDAQVKIPKMRGVTLGTALQIVLRQLTPPGTYLVRRDFIEVTTPAKAIRDKTVRAYPVADLVIPIPNSVNQAGLQQNLSVLGGTFSFGASGFSGSGNTGFIALGAGALGFNNQLGVGGGGLGLVGVAGQLGAGALGTAGGALGQFGGGLGFAGQQGSQNTGVGGGFQGFGGGQLGQFGNLGGQFGLQGGDQSNLLIQLVTEVVARGEWAHSPYLAVTGTNNNPQGAVEPTQEETPILEPKDLNSLYYYPPARALVIRGTSRVHTTLSSILPSAGNAPPVAQGLDERVPNGALVIGPRGKGNAAPAAKPAEKPAEAVAAAKPKAEMNPKKVWQDFLAKGVEDPGVVFAGAEFLGKFGQFDHAAELIKADLRGGPVAKRWPVEALANVQQALSVALQAAGGSAEEVERAKLSALDLNPADPQAHVKAAEALADLGQTDRALALCKRAADLRPEWGDAYSNALVFADNASAKGKPVDTDAVQWAASNLLKRDWAGENDRYHGQARAKLAALEQRLRGTRPDAAARVKAMLDDERVRDLVVELSWQGDADLDLTVVEPSGSVCSAAVRHSPGGGVMVGDRLPEAKEVYTAAEAFGGSYQLRVSRVWGKPLGGKATLKVTRHMGTDRQKQELHTVELAGDAEVKVSLDGGRRTEVAAVVLPQPKKADAVSSDRDVAERLRGMTDPVYRNSVASKGMAAGHSFSAASKTRALRTKDLKADEIVPTAFSYAGLAMTTRTVVTEDGKAAVELAPVFEAAARLDRPTPNLTLIPGAKQ